MCSSFAQHAHEVNSLDWAVGAGLVTVKPIDKLTAVVEITAAGRSEIDV